MLFFASLLIGLYGLRLWLAGFGGIHPDEAYYWVWSKHLSWGYLDHPPMVAWTIALGRFLVDTLIPDSSRQDAPLFWAQVGLRLIPYFLSTVLTPLLIGKCIEWVQRAPLSITQMMALLTMPVFFLGPQVVTPDSPFFMAWSLCLLVAIGFQRRRIYNHLAGDPTPPQYSLSILAGAALAFAAYSKNSAILAAFLIVVSGMGLWNSLLTGLICLALLAPHLYWTATTGLQEGAGVFFQMQNALGTKLKAPNFKWMGDVWASQVLLWTPLVFVSCWVYLFVDIRRFFMSTRLSRLSGTLFLWTFVPVLFFSLTALKRPAEANWALIGSVAAVTWVVARFRAYAFWLWALIFSNLTLLALIFLILTQGPVLADALHNKAPQLAAKLRQPSRIEEFAGWERLHTLLGDAVRADDLEIQVESYQVLSALLFQDSVVPKDKALSERLKIWVEGSRRSEFNRHEKYLPKPTQPHWLVLRQKPRERSGCDFQQDLIKGGATGIFRLYRCS